MWEIEQRLPSVATFMAVALAGGALFACGAAASTPTITEFSAGLNPGAQPGSGITTGPDGNLWFTDGSAAIGRITPAGAISEFGTGLNPGSQPLRITAGPDGNLWFSDFGTTPAVGRINPSTHQIDEFTAGLNSGGMPESLVTGPDGAVWFTDRGTTSAIGRIDPGTHTIQEFSTGLNAGSRLRGIAVGADGNIWFADRGTTKAIGRINPGTHAIQEFSTGLGSSANPQGLTASSDGNLWFSDFSSPAIGRSTLTGSIDEFSAGLPSGSVPTFIAAGSDGSTWFTDEGTTAAIGRVTPSGAITEFTAGLNSGSSPSGITPGPDGNVWFADGGSTPAIGRITMPPAAVTGAASVLGSGAASVAGTVNGRAQPTSGRFEFGTTPSYGSETPAVDAGTGFANVPTTATLSGLLPNTTYHFRAAATNPTDTAFGADATFTTLPLPTVSGIRVAPKTWRDGSRLAQIAKRRKKRPPIGTRITFSLSRAATVQLQFVSIRPGRRVKKKCAAPTRRNRKARRCTRRVPAGMLTLPGHAGPNTVSFQGLITGRQKLKAGRYQLRVTPIDPTTPLHSPAGVAGFTIAKR
ncbi:MAG: virginiamycin lyase [Thermoleophilaceae bacterium]|nr:virginiamycin lyase [Thermoleophilaceae bacterium]